MQLQWIVSLRRRDIGFVKLNRRSGEGPFGIPALALHPLNRAVSREGLRRIVACSRCFDIGFFFSA